MTTWYSKDIGDGGQAFGPSIQIQQEFLALYVAGGKSEGAAVFSRYKSSTDKVTVYFTPEAEALARKFNAIACEKPAANEVTYLLGDRHSIGRHFPENANQAVTSRLIARPNDRSRGPMTAF